jgi:2-phospho-L-lactate guanylyltransferase
MSLWAVVPVKPLRRGKSRLASVLSEDERAQLNKNMLIHTVKTLVSVPELEHVLVVSRDPKALAISRELGARTVQENGSPHLNVALTRATMVATTYAARAVLVLPADLPRLCPQDVQALIAAAQDPPVVAIAPDYHGHGTNGLLINPATLIQYQFGENSFERHLEQIKAKGLKPVIFERPSLAQDVDLPEDLEFLNGHLADWTSGRMNGQCEETEPEVMGE